MLDNTEILDLAHGSILSEHPLHSAGEMSLRCNTRDVPCDSNCRSANLSPMYDLYENVRYRLGKQ